jgi:ATP-dependent 26S proteasome regulatory subunit
VARRAAEENNALGRVWEELSKVGDNSLAFDERMAALARLRQNGAEIATEADRIILEQIARQHEALSEVEEEHRKLRAFISSLTAPPYFPAVFLAAANTPEVHGALVQTDTERRVVQMGEGASSAQLTPGDEVYLTHERNYLIGKSDSPSFLTGEIATYSRSTGDGRLVLRSRDEEVVVLPTAALRAASLKAGDGVRFSRATGLAFETIEPSKGEEFFLEATPRDSFDDVGGLDREIEMLKRVLTLHMFHSGTAGKYKLRRKKAVLMEGPPGNGKTKVARATCAWLATLSRSGRSHFINVKPGALNSMWYGATEQRYREIFRVAREAAAAEPEVPVVMFWDEIDAIGGSRGESSASTTACSTPSWLS